MKNYAVECEKSLAELVASVNELVKVGYNPIGGIILNETKYGTEYYQALFIDDNNESNN